MIRSTADDSLSPRLRVTYRRRGARYRLVRRTGGRGPLRHDAADDGLSRRSGPRRIRRRLTPAAARRYMLAVLALLVVSLCATGIQTWRVAVQGRELARLRAEVAAGPDASAAKATRSEDSSAPDSGTATVPSSPGDTSPTAQGVGQEGQPAQGKGPDVQPYQVYTVKAGDTLWDIAARLYGDGRMFSVLAAGNKLSDPGHLEEGRVLIVPPVSPATAPEGH